MPIRESELILNPDGSVYHLNLLPKYVSKNIILVGDQDRVEKVSKHFDTIEFSTQKREFKTQTGYYKGKRISVISTGIGPDNIDIVVNELDALFNIDLITRKPKEKLIGLNFIRVGTSGSLQKDIPVDSFVISEYGLDLNGMLLAYQIDQVCNHDMEEAFVTQTNWHKNKSKPLVIKASDKLLNVFEGPKTQKGITATAGGFYGPQGRVLRLPLQDASLNGKMDTFNFNGKKITNLEMETSAIYGLSKLLGHEAVSLNAIIANRPLGNFSKDTSAIIENLIRYTLNKIAEKID